LKRRGFSPDAIAGLRRAYKTLYRSGLKLEDAITAIAAEAGTPGEPTPLAELVEFLSAPGRGILR
jgi:UDP-N-acetylglucosamine acyltransferase